MGDLADRLYVLLDPTNPEAFSRRLCLGHRIAVFAIPLISIPFASWRVTLGLLLGGLLSLLNFSMLRSSAEAVIAGAAAGKIRKFPASRFVLRYVAVGSGILLAYWLNIISVPAAIAGLCAIVVPLMFEGGLQFYYAIVNRED